MTANTTDHLQALRQQVADVLERHDWYGSTDKLDQPVRKCSACRQAWPCETITLARRMTTLLDGIVFYAEEANHKSNGPIGNGLDWGGMAQQAIASAAQKQEDESGSP